MQQKNDKLYIKYIRSRSIYKNLKFNWQTRVSLIILFAFATLISWFYYARIGIKYLKINYFVFYVVYLVVIVISVYFKLINLMNLTNYLNISLLIINLCYLFKRVFVVKLKPTGDDLDAKE